MKTQPARAKNWCRRALRSHTRRTVDDNEDAQARQGPWQGYFDRLSKHLKAQTVTILVEGLDLGVQHQTDRAVLRGITYDSGDDTIEIDADALRHRVQHPRDLYVQEDADGALAAIKVADADGREQIVQLESSLALPASR